MNLKKTKTKKLFRNEKYNIKKNNFQVQKDVNE